MSKDLIKRTNSDQLGYEKISEKSINDKHLHWKEYFNEKLLESRSYYYNNINVLFIDNHLLISKTLTNNSFTENQKMLSTINEKLNNFIMNIYASFNNILYKLESHLDYQNSDNKNFVFGIGKYMDNLNNIMNNSVYCLENVFNKKCFSENPLYNKAEYDILIENIIHNTSIDYVRFSNLNKVIDFFSHCIKTSNSEQKISIVSMIYKEMTILTTELYNISCYFSEIARSINIRYETLKSIDFVSDLISNILFNYIHDGIDFMIKEIIKGDEKLIDQYNNLNNTLI